MWRTPGLPDPPSLGQDTVLRVLVLGSAAAMTLSPPRSGPSELSYSEWLEPLLYRQGLRASVRNLSECNVMISKALCRYESEIQARCPHVVVLNYGMSESYPPVVPVHVVQHLFGVHAHPGRVRTAYRAWARRRVWPVLRGSIRSSAFLLGQHWHRLPPERYARELTNLITLIRRDCQALVLALDLFEPGPALRHAVPGIAGRRDRYNEITFKAVTGIGEPDVRMVETCALLAEQGWPNVLPDGVNLNARGHALVAQLLAAEIGQWSRGWDGV